MTASVPGHVAEDAWLIESNYLYAMGHAIPLLLINAVTVLELQVNMLLCSSVSRRANFLKNHVMFL